MGLSLYNLVSLREQLSSQYNIEGISHELKKLQNQLDHIIKVEGYTNYIDSQITLYQDILEQITLQHSSVNKVLTAIDLSIKSKREELFSGSYEEDLIRAMNNHENRLVRNYKINDDSKEVLIKRLRGYTDFHYPVLEFGCRSGTYTNYLVAGDPLYIVDLNQRFIDVTLEQFSEVYRNRVRPYVVDLITPEKNNLNKLPQNQFGFIFSWEFFNYLPLSILECYLVQFYDLLRPGGAALIRFNNGDSSLGANSAETRWQSYISGKELVDSCKRIGFELLELVNVNLGETSWIEIKRPGKLKTVKASQSLGAIKDKVN